MKLMYSLFFGAGVAAFAYARMGRRVGYGNTTNVWVIVSVVFILVSIFFFTAFSFFMPEN